MRRHVCGDSGSLERGSDRYADMPQLGLKSKRSAAIDHCAKAAPNPVIDRVGALGGCLCLWKELSGV